MHSCQSCAAPLRADDVVCEYCNVRNQIDLKAEWISLSYGSSERTCPHCSIMLSTVHVYGKSKDDIIEIEQCDTCHGMFFDNGEVEKILEAHVSNEVTDQPKLIDNINRDRVRLVRDFSYIDCPVCTKKMNRKNFGFKSGVIVDQCRQHGVWLDSGELLHLMEWKKANGLQLDQQHKKRQEQVLKTQQRKERTASVERQHIINQQRSDVTSWGVVAEGLAAVFKWLF